MNNLSCLLYKYRQYKVKACYKFSKEYQLLISIKNILNENYVLNSLKVRGIKNKILIRF